MNNTYYTMEPQQELQNTAYSLWQPDGSGASNKKIIVDSGISSNWSYRQYMQKNANQIMKYNTMQTINDSGNNPYSVLNTASTSPSPHLYTSTHDNSNPAYGFRNSDLKQAYTTKQQMKAKMISPSIPTNF
jgi:hypothetical protein